ncbi:DUF4865 family protein [Actinophytocola xanthii]|uniref:DUF4865 domain-containing protein n=1 Tax=Actinophytocola xanthii TaxID=1912961 RepID=A0A1Q8CW00_9PSEU|nr:DUF4865 family protein [Actinophytocola xanthii]OLF18529.1 hypothetical protein BU204_06145 [Actinophytocola xanthii]
MIAAQYEIGLPADYDMGVIRRRVAERGSALDGRAGLGLKAYLVRDIADGEPVNAYAPFYLWNDPAAMAAFHWEGQGFGGIVRDFGRPVVRTWVGGRFRPGDGIGDAPSHAVRTSVPFGPDLDPQREADRVDDLARAAAAEPGTHSVAWAVDTVRWEAVVLRLLGRAPEGEDGTTYRVHHLSAPGIGDLPR